MIKALAILHAYLAVFQWHRNGRDSVKRRDADSLYEEFVRTSYEFSSVGMPSMLAQVSSNMFSTRFPSSKFLKQISYHLLFRVSFS